MSSLRSHLERRAADLADCATLEVKHKDGFDWVTLRPMNPAAVAVLLYVGWEDQLGTVSLDNQACGPWELGSDQDENRQGIDYFVDVAVEGRATAFYLGQGGVIEIKDGDSVARFRMNCLSLVPGWRWCATKIVFEPYRAGIPRN